jgi:hypothetical protein
METLVEVSNQAVRDSKKMVDLIMEINVALTLVKVNMDKLDQSVAAPYKDQHMQDARVRCIYRKLNDIKHSFDEHAVPKSEGLEDAPMEVSQATQCGIVLDVDDDRKVGR